MALKFVIFFSSRRRHTRWPRDWSSDVCSSDLAGVERHQRLGHGRERPAGARRLKIGRASCKGKSVDRGGRGSETEKEARSAELGIGEIPLASLRRSDYAMDYM